MAILDDIKVDDDGVALKPNEAEDALDNLILSESQQSPPAETPAADSKPAEEPAAAEETPAPAEKPAGDTVPLAKALSWKGDAKEAKAALEDATETIETLKEALVDKANAEAAAKVPEDDAGASPLMEYLKENGEHLRYDEIPAKVHMDQRNWENQRQARAQNPDDIQHKATVQAKLTYIKQMKGRGKALVGLANELLTDADRRAVLKADEPRSELLERSWKRIHESGSAEEKATAAALYPDHAKPDPDNPGATTPGKPKTNSGDNSPVGDMGVSIPAHVKELNDFLS